MRRNPLYNFKNLSSTGIASVPLNSTVSIVDSDNNNTPKTVQLISKKYDDGSFFNDTTTIGEFLESKSAYIDQNVSMEIPSEIEKITEGPDHMQKTGWRLLGQSPDKHSLIGINSLDLTTVTAPISGISTYGASGNYAFAEGLNTHAVGAVSKACGEETIALNNHSFCIGRFNKGVNTKNIFEIGIGRAGSRQNAFEVSENGLIVAPNLSTDMINNFGNKCLINKEYSDLNLDSKYNKDGGTITGGVSIVGRVGYEADLSVGRNITIGGDLTINGEIGVGVDAEGLSSIKFYDRDTNSSNQPQLIYDNSDKRFFFKIPAYTGLISIWNEKYQGVGTGLDADKLQGIDGSLFATTQYVDNQIISGLNQKFDKSGGVISGPVVVNGGLVSELNTTLYGDVSIEHISSKLNIDGTLTVGSDAFLRRNMDIDGKLRMGIVSNGNSIIEFTNNSANNIIPKIYWDNALNKFNVETEEGSNLELWHAGNFDPNSKMDISNGTIDNFNIVYKLNVGQEAVIPSITNPIEFQNDIVVRGHNKNNQDITIGLNLDQDYKIRFGDYNLNNTIPAIYWKSSSGNFKLDTQNTTDNTIWHGGNFNPNNKLSVTGGTMSGDLNLDSNLNVDGDVYINGVSVVNNVDIRGEALFINSPKISLNNNKSGIAFEGFDQQDNNNLIEPKIYWNDVNQEIEMDTISYNYDSYGTKIYNGFQTNNIIWHSGNMNKDDFYNKNEDFITTNEVYMHNLPQIPGSIGQLWNDNGTLKIS